MKRPRRLCRAEFDRLESRRLLSTFVVNTTADAATPDASLSLREAIELVDGSLALSDLSPQELAQVDDPEMIAGPNAIAFAILGPVGPDGAFTIVPASPLPPVLRPVTIDGTTQPGYQPPIASQSALLSIVLDGTNAGPGADGLVIRGGRSVVRGLAINGFDGNGLRVEGAGGNTIAGDFLGTSNAGLIDRGNGRAGLLIDGSPGNFVGGTTLADANVLSGNTGDGLFIAGSGNSGGFGGNVILGNRIGTDAKGTMPLPNLSFGVELETSNNTVGGITPGAANVISNNSSDGVRIVAGSTGNLIAGNLIGTDPAGTLREGNLRDGMDVEGSGNTIGGLGAAGNLISDNRANGLLIGGLGTTSNLVLGNRVGTDRSGTRSLGNSNNGIVVSTAGNTIGGTAPSAGNLVSANGSDGIFIAGPGATGNLILGNTVGTDLDGKNYLGNFIRGIDLEGPGNTVGGTTAGAGNLISANASGGLIINGPGATGNLVLGNRIGTDRSGSAGIANNVGVAIFTASNTIGGTTPGAGNLISGNGNEGIRILGQQAGNNLIVGNRIGTDAAGTRAVGNLGFGLTVESPNNTIGGSDPGAGNLISANEFDGLLVDSSLATGTVIEGNRIGTDATGRLALGNLLAGIHIEEAIGVRVGGTGSGQGNDIAGNGGDGIRLGSGSASNVVEGNKIGVDPTGSTAVRNGGSGVAIIDSSRNTIGGRAQGAGNLISGNRQYGVAIEIQSGDSSFNAIQGNLIGTNSAGLSSIPNRLDGVDIDSAASNLVGGAAPGTGNLISGNGANGISIFGPTARGNQIAGNRIGTDVSGLNRLGNEFNGVQIQNAVGNIIGANAPSPPNIISGNLLNGILFTGTTTSGNLILDDRIGTDINGSAAVPNGDDGIAINDAPGNVVGVAGSPVLVSGNGGNGIGIVDVRPAIGQTSPPVVIQAALIGTDATGSRAIPNGASGIRLDRTVGGRIGGATDGLRDVISGNTLAGLSLVNGSDGNLILGNFIGTDRSGEAALPNGLGIILDGVSDNTIGGTAESRNLISGNRTNGVTLTGTGASGNLIAGNAIGLDRAGAMAIGNGIGVSIDDVPGNQIVGNLISGNTEGIQIAGADASGNEVFGNLIGTDATGTRAILKPGATSFDAGLFSDGILINDAPANIIGRDDAPNVIVGQEVGVVIAGEHSKINLVDGNRIGTDPTGTSALGNGVGVYLNNVTVNTISGNLISGNEVTGITIFGNEPGVNQGNNVSGNVIGPALGGSTPLIGTPGVTKAADGVFIDRSSGDSVLNNTIGGLTGTGIYLFDGAARTVILANRIGNPLPNQTYGVLLLNASSNPIAGLRGKGNVFGHNGIANVREFTGRVPGTKASVAHPRGPSKR